MFDSTNHCSTQSILTSPAIIQLRQLVKSYHTPAGDMPALRGLGLAVTSGEFIAVEGKSGAGKSTLVNMITGIDRPDSGEIVIAGTEVHALVRR